MLTISWLGLIAVLGLLPQKPTPPLSPDVHLKAKYIMPAKDWLAYCWRDSQNLLVLHKGDDQQWQLSSTSVGSTRLNSITLQGTNTLPKQFTDICTFSPSPSGRYLYLEYEYRFQDPNSSRIRSKHPDRYARFLEPMSDIVIDIQTGLLIGIAHNQQVLWRRSKDVLAIISLSRNPIDKVTLLDLPTGVVRSQKIGYLIPSDVCAGERLDGRMINVRGFRPNNRQFPERLLAMRAYDFGLDAGSTPIHFSSIAHPPSHTSISAVQIAPDSKRILWVIAEDNGIVAEYLLWLSDTNANYFREVGRLRYRSQSGALASKISWIQWHPDGRHISYVRDEKLYQSELP